MSDIQVISPELIAILLAREKVSVGSNEEQSDGPPPIMEKLSPVEKPAVTKKSKCLAKIDEQEENNSNET